MIAGRCPCCVCNNVHCLVYHEGHSCGKPRALLDLICPNCGREELAQIKGCLRCLICGYKQDCNGW